MELTIMRDGLKLYGQLDRPKKETCPIVILFHGFGGDIGIRPDEVYQKLTKKLLEKDLAVIRFDFNGHGKSEGKFSTMNLFNEIEDAIAIIEYVRTLDWVDQIHLIGHSQGGVIAGMLAGYYADLISRLVLLAPAASLKTDAQKGQCMKAHYDTNHIPVTVKVDEFHEVGGHYFRIAKSLPIFEVTAQFDGPALVLIGEKDESVSVEEAKNYSKTMKNCSFEKLSALDHGLNGPSQALLLEKAVNFLRG